MDVLFAVVKQISDLGATVMLPILLTILGLAFRMKLGDAMKAGLTVGVGFAGLQLAISLLFQGLSPAIDYYRALGTGFTMINPPWPVFGGACWAAPFAALVVPTGVVLNLVLLNFKLTKVMNVDIWNYIHFLGVGSMAWALFDSFVLGYLIAVALSVVTLYFGQAQAKHWQEYFGLEGTCCSTMYFVTWMYPFGWFVNKIIDYIPGLNKLDLSMDRIQSKLEVFGDPIFVGLFMGILMAALTLQHWTKFLYMGVYVAAAMVILPRMVSLFMEGLSMIGTAVRAYLKKRTEAKGEEREILIGMDVALGLGDPCVITTTILAIPIIIGLAFVVPGTGFFPIGMTTSICYSAVFTGLTSNGNLLRSMVVITLVIIGGLYFGTNFAPEQTLWFQKVGLAGPDDMYAGNSFNPWQAVVIWSYRLTGGS